MLPRCAASPFARPLLRHRVVAVKPALAESRASARNAPLPFLVCICAMLIIPALRYGSATVPFSAVSKPPRALRNALQKALDCEEEKICFLSVSEMLRRSLEGKWAALACHETRSVVVQNAFQTLEESTKDGIVAKLLGQGAANYLTPTTAAWAKTILNDTSTSYLANIASRADTYCATTAGAWSGDAAALIDAEDNLQHPAASTTHATAAPPAAPSPPSQTTPSAWV
ncbi:hypothetical protein B0H13DRAFT_2352837 [Mycena leptocephala]|nr:hypothetical protein B0H13DRAFT_2352837 [Mycena leptocephala]